VHLLFSPIIIAVFYSFVKRINENIFCLPSPLPGEKGCFPAAPVVYFKKVFSFPCDQKEDPHGRTSEFPLRFQRF